MISSRPFTRIACMGASAPVAGPPVKTTLGDALRDMQRRYRALSLQAEKLKEIGRASGRPLPVAALTLYRAACADYLRFANDVFKELAKRRYRVQQVVMSQGRPVKTVDVDAPLRPPEFGTGTAVPATAMGLPLIPIVVIGALLIIGAGGYVTVKVLDKISVLMNRQEWKPDEQLDAWIRANTAFAKAGFSPKEAADRATAVTAKPPGGVGLPEALAYGALGLGALGVAALVLGHGKSAPT